MKVGFVGIGRMGLPMARNVLAAGHELAVWNRTASRCELLAAAGARVAPSPRGVCDGAEVVVSMVADAQAARDVLAGDEGVFSGLSAGAVVVEMSTIGPDAARSLAREASSRGIVFLDAPVSGSVPAAEAGELVAMVGGPPEALEHVLPVLAAMTREQLHMGDVGTGAAMKLVVNSVVAITNEAVAEALALAGACGIDAAAAYDVLERGAVASPFVRYKRAAFLEPGSAPVAFTTALMRKDLDLALALGARAGLRLPATSAAAEVLEAASARGLDDADLARVVDVVREGIVAAGE